MGKETERESFWDRLKIWNKPDPSKRKKSKSAELFGAQDKKMKKFKPTRY